MPLLSQPGFLPHPHSCASLTPYNSISLRRERDGSNNGYVLFLRVDGRGRGWEGRSRLVVGPPLESTLRKLKRTTTPRNPFPPWERW